MPSSADVLCADLQRLSAREARERRPAWLRSLLANVALRSRVLEVGCGTGELARELVTRRGARVTAIDTCPRQIEIARVRTPHALGIDYYVANICELAPEGFDVVISADVSSTLARDTDRAIALSHMAGAVNHGGVVLLAGGLADTSLFGTLLGIRRARRALGAQMPGVRVLRHFGRRFTAIWQRG